MRIFHQIAVTGLVTFACLSSARAGDDWKNVSLGGQPDFTIDVPAVVGDNFKSAAETKDQLMDFTVAMDDLGSMSCNVFGFSYAPDFTREILVSALARGAVDRFCEESGKNISGWELNSAGAMTVDGLPGGQCSAAYTNSQSRQPGMVEADMVVAGHAKYYVLGCFSSREDKGKAISAFVMTWEDSIKHMQQSLRLPASEK